MFNDGPFEAVNDSGLNRCTRSLTSVFSEALLAVLLKSGTTDETSAPSVVLSGAAVVP